MEKNQETLDKQVVSKASAHDQERSEIIFATADKSHSKKENEENIEDKKVSQLSAEGEVQQNEQNVEPVQQTPNLEGRIPNNTPPVLDEEKEEELKEGKSIELIFADDSPEIPEETGNGSGGDGGGIGSDDGDENPIQTKEGTETTETKPSKTAKEDVMDKMEASFGTDFSNVQIHENSSSASDNGALAYAQGDQIHFAPGQYQPDTQSGQELIGHELAHIVQQREGRVQATSTANGMPINDDKALEKEADELGAKAATNPLPVQKKKDPGHTAVNTDVPRQFDKKEKPKKETKKELEEAYESFGGSSAKTDALDQLAEYIAQRTVALRGSGGSVGKIQDSSLQIAADSEAMSYLHSIGYWEDLTRRKQKAAEELYESWASETDATKGNRTKGYRDVTSDSDEKKKVKELLTEIISVTRTKSYDEESSKRQHAKSLKLKAGDAMKNGGFAWSATTVSYIMWKAGMGDTFEYAESHIGYTSAAKKNKRKGSGTQQLSKAFGKGAASVEVGDILVRARAQDKPKEGETKKPLATYDRLSGNTHGDVVVGIDVYGEEGSGDGTKKVRKKVPGKKKKQKVEVKSGRKSIGSYQQVQVMYEDYFLEESALGNALVLPFDQWMKEQKYFVYAEVIGGNTTDFDMNKGKQNESGTVGKNYIPLTHDKKIKDKTGRNNKSYKKSDAYIGVIKSVLPAPEESMPADDQENANQLPSPSTEAAPVQKKTEAQALTRSQPIQKKEPTFTGGKTNLTFSEVTYDVNGDYNKIYQKFANNGEAGSISPQILGSKISESKDGKSLSIIVSVQIKKTMPVWKDLHSIRKNAADNKNEYQAYYKKVVAAWDKFYASLDAHENAHLAIDKKHYGSIDQNLRGKTEAQLDAELDKIEKAAEKENHDFHDSKKSAIFKLPYIQKKVEKVKQKALAPPSLQFSAPSKNTSLKQFSRVKQFAGGSESSIRDSIVSLAQGEIGKVQSMIDDGSGNKKGYERLLEYFDTSAPGVWPEDVIKSIKYQGPSFSGKSANKDGSPTSGDQNGAKFPHWCGIFAIWAVKKAGKDVGNWVPGKGVLGAGKLGTTKSPKPGDIGYINLPKQHHTVIKEVKGDTIISIDGNMEFGEVREVTRAKGLYSGFFTAFGGDAIQKKKSSEVSATNESNHDGSPDAGDIMQKMEASFGTSFADVNIHQNSGEAKKAGALAFAQGNDVHFAPGQFKPNTSQGQELIGHELAHVVQQKEGRVEGTKQEGGHSVNDNPILEKEADEMGKKAASGKESTSRSTRQLKSNSGPRQFEKPKDVAPQTFIFDPYKYKDNLITRDLIMKFLDTFVNDRGESLIIQFSMQASGYAQIGWLPAYIEVGFNTSFAYEKMQDFTYLLSANFDLSGKFGVGKATKKGGGAVGIAANAGYSYQWEYGGSKAVAGSIYNHLVNLYLKLEKDDKLSEDQKEKLKIPLKDTNFVEAGAKKEIEVTTLGAGGFAKGEAKLGDNKGASGSVEAMWSSSKVTHKDKEDKDGKDRTSEESTFAVNGNVNLELPWLGGIVVEVPASFSTTAVAGDPNVNMNGKYQDFVIQPTLLVEAKQIQELLKTWGSKSGSMVSKACTLASKMPGFGDINTALLASAVQLIVETIPKAGSQISKFVPDKFFENKNSKLKVAPKIAFKWRQQESSGKRSYELMKWSLALELGKVYGAENTEDGKASLEASVSGSATIKLGGGIGTNTLYFIRQTYIDAPEDKSSKKPEWIAFKSSKKAEIAEAIYNVVYNNGAGPSRNSSAGSTDEWNNLFARIKGAGEDKSKFCSDNADSLIKDLEKCFDKDDANIKEADVAVRDFVDLLSRIKSQFITSSETLDKVIVALKIQYKKGGKPAVKSFLALTASYGIDPVGVIQILGRFWGESAKSWFDKWDIPYKSYQQRATEPKLAQYERMANILKVRMVGNESVASALIQSATFGYEGEISDGDDGGGILEIFKYARNDSDFIEELKLDSIRTVLLQNNYKYEFHPVLVLVYFLEKDFNFKAFLKSWEHTTDWDMAIFRMEVIQILGESGYQFGIKVYGGDKETHNLMAYVGKYEAMAARAKDILLKGYSWWTGYAMADQWYFYNLIADAKNDLFLFKSLKHYAISYPHTETNPLRWLWLKITHGVDQKNLNYMLENPPKLGLSNVDELREAGIDYKKGYGAVAQKQTEGATSSQKNGALAEIPSDVNVHKESSEATNLGALAFARGSDIHFAPGQFKPDTRSGQELIGHELGHIQQQKAGRVQATSHTQGQAVNDDQSLEKEADDFGKAFANKLEPSAANTIDQNKSAQFSLDKDRPAQMKENPKDPNETSSGGNRPTEKKPFSLNTKSGKNTTQAAPFDFSKSDSNLRTVAQKTPDKKTDTIPEANNQFYAHGSFMGAGIELMDDEKWNYILLKLMPDVHADVTKAIKDEAGSEKVIIMFENNPVTAAYGLARTQAKDAANENGRSDRLDKLTAFEWDAFLDPKTIKKYKEAETETEKASIAIELVDGLVIAHGNTSQTVKENGPWGGLRQYDNVRGTSKSGQGGVAAGAWMDLFGKAMIIGSDPDWKAKADEIGSKSRVDNKKDQTSDKTFKDKMSFSDVVELYKTTYGKELFSVILDVKSRDTNPDVLTGLIKELNKRDVHVYGVGSFIDSELQGLRNVEQVIDGKKVAGALQVLFFHKAGDLQEACLSYSIAPGDTVMFNAGNLIDYDRFSRGENKKKSYKVKEEVVKQIGEYKTRFGFSLGVYVQENAIDDRAATLITDLTNAKPEIFDLGFAWGGVTGETAADIEPSLGSEKTGIGGQWVVGTEWDTDRDLPNALTLQEAKDAIYEAGSGLGTDEEGIYSAIRNCVDRAGLESDAKIMAELKDEMSGHDLWKAFLLLEYGSEAFFPSTIQEIWDATKGWGTDEDQIYQALQKLNATQIDTIKKVPGLRDILKDELSGDDLEASDDLLSGSYAKAIENHKKDVKKMQQILKQMSKGTEIERNTAEWLNPNREGGAKNDLHVCTKTHDAKERAKKHKGKDNYNAYFGANEIVPETASYDAHVDSTRNIRFVQAGTGGHHLNKDIWMYDVRRNPNSTKTVMIHEVQHDADRHDKEAGHDKPTGSPEESWNRYKTEFRAYWVDGRYDSVSADHDPKIKDFHNLRQKTIFDLLHGKSKKDSLYPWLWDAYDKNVEVNGTKFKNLVHSYAKPEGINLKNSPRVDDFYNALEKCKPEHSVNSPQLQTVIDFADNLNYSEVRHILFEPGSNRIRQMMNQNLSNRANAKVNAVLCSKIVGDFPVHDPKDGILV